MDDLLCLQCRYFVFGICILMSNWCSYFERGMLSYLMTFLEGSYFAILFPLSRWSSFTCISKLNAGISYFAMCHVMTDMTSFQALLPTVLPSPVLAFLSLIHSLARSLTHSLIQLLCVRFSCLLSCPALPLFTPLCHRV